MIKWLLALGAFSVLFAPNASAQFWTITDGPSAPTTCLATNSKGHVFVGTTVSAVYKSTDNGVSWLRKDQGIDDGGPLTFPINQIKLGVNDQLFAAVNGYGIVRSTNDGESWQKLDIGIEVSTNSRLCVSTKLLPNGKTSVFVGYDGGASKLFFRLSEDDGATWIEIPKTGIPAATSSIFDVFLSPNSDKMFIAVSYNLGLFRTTNRGASWRRIDNAEVGSGESDDHFLTFGADRDGRIYVGKNALPSSVKTKNAVILRSSDDGEGWEYLMEGWDNRDITNNHVTGISFGAGGDVWAITDKVSGIFYSSNGGDNWVSRNDGIDGDGSGRGIAVAPDGSVFSAPTGPYVYRHVITNSVNELPSVFNNVSAYPNPASNSATISFTLTRSSRVTLELHAVTGELISTQEIDNLNAGTHSAILDASILPAGLYYYTLRANGTSNTNKLSLTH